MPEFNGLLFLAPLFFYGMVSVKYPCNEPPF